MGKSMSVNTFLVTKESHQIERLSPDFKASLRKAIDDMAAKRQAQVAQVDSQSPSGDKVVLAKDVLTKVSEFVNHHVNDWLLSLDDGSLQEIGRLFDEMNGVSSAELGCNSPFEAVAKMISSGHGEEPEMVVEEQIDVPPVAPDGTPQQPKQVMHEEHIPVEEGMNPGMGQ